MSLERRLDAIWYGSRRPGTALRGLSVLYGLAVRLRAWLYRQGLGRRQRLPVPVVVVGNRVAGGTGKTPLILALVRHLRQAGHRPGVVSRGYGRRGRGLVRVEAETDPARGGDEPVLIARLGRVPVAVCGDRARAGRALVAAGCDLVLADDGLQHLALARDLEIEVIDAERGYGNGRLLPAGPLREPLPERFEGLRVSRDGEGREGVWPMRLTLGAAVPLAGGSPRPLADFAGMRVHAVAGIAHPERFFRALAERGIEPVAHPFPDHHRFRADELHFEEDLPVLMTAKDAVKCRGIAPPGSCWVELHAELPEGFFREFDRRLGIDRHD